MRIGGQRRGREHLRRRVRVGVDAHQQARGAAVAVVVRRRVEPAGQLEERVTIKGQPVRRRQLHLPTRGQRPVHNDDSGNGDNRQRELPPVDLPGLQHARPVGAGFESWIDGEMRLQRIQAAAGHEVCELARMEQDHVGQWRDQVGDSCAHVPFDVRRHRADLAPAEVEPVPRNPPGGGQHGDDVETNSAPERAAITRHGDLDRAAFAGFRQTHVARRAGRGARDVRQRDAGKLRGRLLTTGREDAGGDRTGRQREQTTPGDPIARTAGDRPTAGHGWRSRANRGGAERIGWRHRDSRCCGRRGVILASNARGQRANSWDSCSGQRDSVARRSTVGFRGRSVVSRLRRLVFLRLFYSTLSRALPRRLIELKAQEASSRRVPDNRARLVGFNSDDSFKNVICHTLVM